MVDVFLEFEDKQKLFDRHIGDFYYWHYIRYSIYKRVFLSDVISRQVNNKPKVKDLMTMLYCALFRNTWFVHKHVDILAFGYSRKIKNPDGTREDPYIEPIVRNTSHSSLTLETYSRRFNNIDSDPQYVKFIEETVLYKRIIEKFMSSKEKSKLYAEAEYIFNLFSQFNSPMTQEAVFQDIKGAYCSRKAFLPKMRRLLKKTTPYCVIATAFCAMETFEIALEQNIPTIEIEHGFFTEMTIPHNFFRKRQIKSYPQYFFANSQYKPDNVRFPISNDHIKVVGSPYLEKQVKNRKSQMVSGEIVILDDNKYDELLLNFAQKLLKYIKDKNLTGYHLTVKAHPANRCDSLAWQSIKNCLEITCITGVYGKNVYECLEQAEIVVGVWSSTLFEAQAYGCKVCVIECEGSKANQKFVEQGYGTYITDPQDVFNAKDSSNHKLLWHPDALNSTLTEIDKIIESARNKELAKN